MSFDFCKIPLLNLILSCSDTSVAKALRIDVNIEKYPIKSPLRSEYLYFDDLKNLIGKPLRVEDIDQGFYKYGVRLSDSEQLQGVKDGKVHECELYQAVRDLFAKNPKNEAYKKLAQSLVDASQEALTATHHTVGFSGYVPPVEEDIPYLQKAICLDPQNVEALFGLAIRMRDVSQYPEANRIYQYFLKNPEKISPEKLQVLKRHLDIPSATYDYDNLGVRYYLNQMNSVNQTVQLVGQWEVGPKTGTAPDIKKVDEAIAAYRKAISILPPDRIRNEYYLKFGILLHHQNKNEEAIKFFDLVAKEGEEESTKRLQVARKWDKKAIAEFSIEYGIAHLFWGAALIREGKTKEALPHVKTAKKILVDAESINKPVVNYEPFITKLLRDAKKP